MISPIIPVAFSKKTNEKSNQSALDLTDSVTSEVPVFGKNVDLQIESEAKLMTQSSLDDEVLLIKKGDSSAPTGLVQHNGTNTLATNADINSAVNQTILTNAVDVLVEADLDIALPDAPTASVDVPANRFVETDDIEGLFYQSRLDFSTIGIDIVESTVLLLKNGLAYIGLRSSPLDIAIPELSESVGGKWAQWRNEEGDYQLKNAAGMWRSIDGVQVNTSPLNPAEVAGTYSRLRAQNWGGTVFTNTQNLTLSDDGVFLTSECSFTSSGGIGSLTPTTVVSVATSDGLSGSSTVGVGNADNDAGSSSVLFTDKRLAELAGNRFGKYVLLEDGLTIEFQYADGSVSRELFFRHGKKVFAGDRSFLLDSRSTKSAFDYLYYSLILNQHQASDAWLAEMGKAQEKYGKSDAGPSADSSQHT